MPTMRSFPSFQRLVQMELAYAGDLPKGASVDLGGGRLTQVSGLPLLVPRSPRRHAHELRRP